MKIECNFHKKTNDFSQNSWKILYNWAIFQDFAVLPYGIKQFRIYLIDIGSHIHTLIQNNSGQSEDSKYEKILEKNIKRWWKFEQFLHFELRFLLTNHNLKWINEESPKIKF